MGAKKAKNDHGVLRSLAHQRMLADDYAGQHLSTFTPGREQSKPLDHHLMGADKLDSDQGIKLFLARSGRGDGDAEVPNVGPALGDDGYRRPLNNEADDHQSAELLDEDVILEIHDGLLSAQTEYV